MIIVMDLPMHRYVENDDQVKKHLEIHVNSINNLHIHTHIQGNVVIETVAIMITNLETQITIFLSVLIMVLTQ